MYRVETRNANGCRGFTTSSSTGTFTSTWTTVSGATSYRPHQVLGGTDIGLQRQSSYVGLERNDGGSYAYHADVCNAEGCGPSAIR